MLFVLAARREAPVGLMTVSKGGVPAAAILTSTIVGFLCVIAAAVSPDTGVLVPAELLRCGHLVRLPADRDLADHPAPANRAGQADRSRCGCSPVLSILVVVAILAVLAQMALNADARTQLLLSLLSWAVVLVIYFATNGCAGRLPAEPVAAAEPTGGRASASWCWPTRPSRATELLDELRAIDRAGNAEYFVCVPANPIDTGQAMHKGPCTSGTPPCEAAQAPARPHAGDPPQREPRRGRRARRLPAAPRAGRRGARRSARTGW